MPRQKRSDHLRFERGTTVRKMQISVQAWWEDYLCLDLRNGKFESIEDDGEDMIEITYDDGMLIAVGKYESINNYCITVVSSDDEIGWNNPISEIVVSDKKDVVRKLQEIIWKYR